MKRINLLVLLLLVMTNFRSLRAMEGGSAKRFSAVLSSSKAFLGAAKNALKDKFNILQPRLQQIQETCTKTAAQVSLTLRDNISAGVETSLTKIRPMLNDVLERLPAAQRALQGSIQQTANTIETIARRAPPQLGVVTTGIFFTFLGSHLIHTSHIRYGQSCNAEHSEKKKRGLKRESSHYYWHGVFWTSCGLGLIVFSNRIVGFVNPIRQRDIPLTPPDNHVSQTDRLLHQNGNPSHPDGSFSETIASPDSSTAPSRRLDNLQEGRVSTLSRDNSTRSITPAFFDNGEYKQSTTTDEHSITLAHSPATRTFQTHSPNACNNAPSSPQPHEPLSLLRRSKELAFLLLSIGAD